MSVVRGVEGEAEFVASPLPSLPIKGRVLRFAVGNAVSTLSVRITLPLTGRAGEGCCRELSA
jgi:hypothetical protein